MQQVIETFFKLFFWDFSSSAFSFYHPIKNQNGQIALPVPVFLKGDWIM